MSGEAKGGQDMCKGAKLYSFRTLTPPLPFVILIAFRLSSNIRTYWEWVTTVQST